MSTPARGDDTALSLADLGGSFVTDGKRTWYSESDADVIIEAYQKSQGRTSEEQEARRMAALRSGGIDRPDQIMSQFDDWLANSVARRQADDQLQRYGIRMGDGRVYRDWEGWFYDWDGDTTETEAAARCCEKWSYDEREEDVYDLHEPLKCHEDRLAMVRTERGGKATFKVKWESQMSAAEKERASWNRKADDDDNEDQQKEEATIPKASSKRKRCMGLVRSKKRSRTVATVQA